MYLKFTFAVWDSYIFLQKQGVGIGTCIASFLCDICLAHHDRLLQDQIKDSQVINVFSYVCNFLIFLDSGDFSFGHSVSTVLTTFKACVAPLEITHELLSEGSLRFLNLRLIVLDDHVCWAHEPWGKKPLLDFQSAHSKLVESSKVNLSLKNNLTKSLPYSITCSFEGQISRLVTAGYVVSP